MARAAFYERDETIRVGETEAQAPGPLIPIPGADHFRVLEALWKPDGALLRAAAELLR